MKDSEDPGSPRVPDEDAAWRDIVDHYGERVLDEESPAQPEPKREPEPTAEVTFDEPDDDWYTPLAEDDDGFVPPEPDPIPMAPDRVLAWGGVLGVPVLALLAVMVVQVTSLQIPGWVGLLAVGAFLGGFGYLVATMPRTREDPWDDGARL